MHVVQNYTHISINLINLFKHFGMEFLLSGIPWNSERILWIGFKKNTNNNKCIFANKQFPKDILLHILSFLGNV